MKYPLTLGLLLLAGGCIFSPDSGPRSAGEGALSAYGLRCEMRRDPLGIDVERPRLSWKLASSQRGQRQTGYRLLVAGSEAELRLGGDLLWDSGAVASDRTLHVEYQGPPLRSRQRCVWSVRVRDVRGRVSAWSEPASFEMGLLEPADWTARWISDGRPPPASDEEQYQVDPAPLLRREFELEGEIVRARLYLSGLGYHEAWVNGRRVGDAVLEPIWTDYSKRVFYSTHDVTGLVRRGGNCLGAMLGRGWYDPLPLRMWGRVNLREHLEIGRPRLIAQLEIEFADGRRETIASDESWRTAPGPLLKNDIYLGELYDARRELPGWDGPGCDDSGWKPAVPVLNGLGPLVGRPLPPIRVTARLTPVTRTEPEPGVFIFDLGRNFAGWARLKVAGPAGSRVRMRYGELLHEDGTLNPLTSVCGQIKSAGKGGPGAPDVAVQADTYVLKGGGPETYTPRFTFHGFRYVELTGYPGEPPLDAIEGLRLACDLEEVGDFACSNELFNRIHEMVRWTFLSNIFGVQSDCPHRERFGYGGDIVATAEAFLMNLDMSSFYPKVVTDFADSAPVSGAFPMTAPYVGIAYAGLEEGESPVGWSVGHPVLLRELYRHYGDRRLVEEQYEAARRWVDYVGAHAEDGIVTKGLSDHESLEERPVRATSTSFYLRGAEIVSALATVLGKDDEALRFGELALEIRAAFARELVTEDSGLVDNGGQAAQAVALAAGLVPASAREAALRRITEPIQTGETSLLTGIFGTQDLLEVLSREGRTDLAYKLVNRTAFPGWGHMLERGATTLWEHWKFSDNTFSHNHPMFGSVSTWMFRWLAGIAPAQDAVGFDRLLLQPQLAPGLDWARASHASIRGPIESSWRLEDGCFRWAVSLPPGVTGEVVLPAACDPARVQESGTPAAGAPHVEEIAPGRYRIGSGRYFFSAPLSSHQPAVSVAAVRDARPNILLLLTDDQRADMLGCAGNEIIETPCIDRLAQEGVLFENAFVTTSICAASRATIFTGLYRRSHGYTFATPPLAAAHATYPALLHAAGYRTGFIGKLGVKFETDVQEEFDFYRHRWPYPYIKEQPDGSSRHLTDIVGDDALEFLRGCEGGQPFCLSVSFNAPHAEDSNEDQFVWPAELDDLYADIDIPAPKSATSAAFEALPVFLQESLGRERFGWRFDTPQKRLAMTRGYYRMITGVDRTVGRILEELERLDLADNTVVIFSSDNGYFLGERGLAGKWLIHEESIRVPLIVRDPRVPEELRGGTLSPIALNVDLAPTILELAGLRAPAEMQGSSLVPLIGGESPPWRSDFFYEHLFEHPKIPKSEGVREERWTYARYFEQEPVFEELYDLAADPGQSRNLAREPSHLETLERLRARCDELRDLYGGPYVGEDR